MDCRIFLMEGAYLTGNLSGWKQHIVACAGGLGAPGLFLISFLDSSVLTFPVINDLLLIELSIEHPARMPLYAFMASLGSVLGCVVLYFIARKGWQARARDSALGGTQRIRGNVGCGASAATDAIQILRACGRGI